MKFKNLINFQRRQGRELAFCCQQKISAEFSLNYANLIKEYNKEWFRTFDVILLRQQCY